MQDHKNLCFFKDINLIIQLDQRDELILRNLIPRFQVVLQHVSKDKLVKLINLKMIETL